MLRHHILFVALALICCANAFPLSALFGGSPYNVPRMTATQLLPLHDGTYLAIMDSEYPVSELKLNSGVRTVPFRSEIPVIGFSRTTIVARLRPANDSVIWAYSISYFFGNVCAAVDDAGSIFVVGEAAYVSDLESINGFRLLRFSANGEGIWSELYTYKALGLPNRYPFFSGGSARSPYIDFAGPRTLAILGMTRTEPTSLGRNAIFVDTITRKARQVRFPLPDGQYEFVEFATVAADSASGAACFVDVTRADTLRGQFGVKNRRLFAQCVNAGGEGEVASRVLVPFQEEAEWAFPHMIMAGGGEEKGAALYVVAIRSFPPVPATGVPPHAGSYSNEAADVTEMLLFKLDPTTLQDVEWESGLISSKPTMRKVVFTDSSRSSAGVVNSLRYIRERDTLVVLYEADQRLDGIETLPSGTIAFRGSSPAERDLMFGQWLLYFGNDAEPVAVPIPQDPRPDGPQDVYNKYLATEFELSKDGRNFYLFGGLQTVDFTRYGPVITVPFPIPEFAQPGAGSPDMEDGMGDGVGGSVEDGVDESFEPSPDESFEPRPDESFELSPDESFELRPDESFELRPDESFELSPDESFELSPGETAEAILDEELESSPNPLQEQYI